MSVLNYTELFLRGRSAISQTPCSSFEYPCSEFPSNLKIVSAFFGASLSSWFRSYSAVKEARNIFKTGKIMADKSKSQYNVVFVLGGPGAGKGTQCEKIQETFGYQHLSAGELLRQERLAKGSQYGEEIEKHLKDGSIVPVAITCSLLHREMESSSKNNFLIDGFPRNKDNLDGWNEAMNGVAQVKRVLFFDCPDQVCVDRCLSRGLTSGRSDDNAESLKKRIQTYRESTMPIVDHFRKINLVSEIQGDKSADEVFEDVKKVFKALDC
ncbi:unnamed protein product [Lymnaea stagnalis]|uniref:UMP-CMP kinase n=1 Tax=Lymnaea stagnalis TaxID=6523 RepID=A0AAV2HK98_LYMST